MDSKPSRVPTPAEVLFSDYAVRVEEGEPVNFEALCAAHPDLAVELRALHARYQAGKDLRGAVGLGAVPPVAGTSEEDSQRRLFERLRLEGPRGTRYKLLGEVARGGMGAILKIWDEELRRTLAMKVVLGRGEQATGDTPAVDPKTLGRFLEEAQITGQLDHPGIVPVHELGLDATGRVYFTMKLVKGEDLRAVFEHVKSGRDGWNQVRALGVLLRVCEAMAFAHSKQVVHRDLKPANVMVGKFGEVYVMDWGLARVLGREDKHDVRIRPASTSTASVVKTERHDDREGTPDSPLVTMDGDVVGTPSFMPPEQARGELDKLGPHSDVYSIGAMLYQLVTGEVPYVPAGTRVSQHTILLAVLREAPPAVEKLAPATPPELVAICEKAMERDIAKRYATTLELAADLRAYLEGRVVAAYETGRWAETRKWVQRNKPLAASLAAAVLALLCGVAFSVNFARETESANVALASKSSELEQRNAEVEAQRAALERTNAELRAASREDKLRGMIQDLARLRAQSRTLDGLDRLGKPAYLWWIEESEKLLNGQEEDLERDIDWRPGLKDVQAKLAELRSAPSLLPYNDEDAARDFDSHPDRAQLRALEAESEALGQQLRDDVAELAGRVTVQALRLGKQPWPADSDVAAKYAKELAATDARQLNSDAWPLVDPDATRPSAEDLVRAMLLARRAVDISDTANKAMVRDTYAWSLVWLGRFDEALAQSAQAVAEAQGEMRAQIAEGSERLRVEAAKWSETERPARETELAQWTAELEQRRTSLEAELAAQKSQLEPKLAALRARCCERRTWRFSESAVEWNHDLLSTLEADLRWQEQMLNHAKEAALSDKAKARWAEAIAAIANAPNYAGQKWPSGDRLTPQLGLLPLGENPATGLWEFVHLQTGTEPELGPGGRVLRDAEGQLTLTPETGMVLVLLPGGRVPEGTGYDMQYGWITAIDLDPLLLSKYELTHEQWDRVSLHRGNHFLAGQPLIPANSISRDNITLMLRRELGWCNLPSESQWEYGCRAGTASKWWSGDDDNELVGVANINELLIDNIVGIQPVGLLRANGFGLHDVHGNVWEWCGDTYHTDTSPRDGDGLRDDDSPTAKRVLRGGSWCETAPSASSASRQALPPEFSEPNCGVRLARPITP